MENYNSVFKDELLQGEAILWAGQPNPNVRFTGADIFIVPFSIMCGWFTLYLEYMFLVNDAPLALKIIGVPFVAMGQYIMIGRFAVKSRGKKSTYYAVTDRRVLCIIDGSRRKIHAALISEMPVIRESIRPTGNGTIIFGNTTYMTSFYGNTGMDYFAAFTGKEAVVFYDIDDAKKVLDLVVAKTGKR